MKSINRKLNAIENKVLQPFVWGSTKWTVQDDAEQKLFDKAVQIAKTVKYEDLTDVQRQIIDKAQSRIWLRGLDLFTSLVGSFIHYDRPFAKRMWHLWLGYFIQEASTGIHQTILEDEIFSQKGKTWKQKEKELGEIEHVEVFTRKRFEQYVSDAIDRSLKPEVKAKLDKAKRKNLCKNLAKELVV